MRERLRNASSLDELEKLIRESETFRNATPYTERSWRKVAEARKRELK